MINLILYYKVFGEKYKCVPKGFRMKPLEEIEQKGLIDTNCELFSGI